MSTILTDDEIRAAISEAGIQFTKPDDAVARAIEAAVLAKLAQQEPVAWQRRMRPTWGKGDALWCPWEDCTEGQFKDYQRVPNLHDWEYQARALYTHPSPQQAEALADSCAAKADRIDRLGEMVQRLQAENSALKADRQRQPEAPTDPIRVACISLDGITLTVPADQLNALGVGDEGDNYTYTLTFKTMTRAEYDALGEFDGF